MVLAVLLDWGILEVLFSISYEKDLIRLNPKSSLIIGERVINASLKSLELETCRLAFVVFKMFSEDKSPS